MKHFLLVGIEHLMTGLILKSDSALRFDMESASTMRVSADTPITAYWQVTQGFIESTEDTEDKDFPKYSHGEMEHYAKNVAQVMRDRETRSFDMQVYTREFMYTVNGRPSRLGPDEPACFPVAVVKAMRRKHGAEADKFLAMLRWSHDHWYYNHDRMYIGVEPDGYIHT